ncbi:response regulator, partial [Morganella morganii]|uniref:response regulator n=1 Tax=Morganella morganii TaxID=582 RepID=UPI0015F5A118
QACQCLLESRGYEVGGWNDSRAFVAQAPLHTYGIVLLDRRMPHCDGCRGQQSRQEQHSTLAGRFRTGQGDLPRAGEEMKTGGGEGTQKPGCTQAVEAAR